MRIVTQQSVGGPEVLEIRDVPDPQPGPGEVRVRVAAAGVNPVDIAVRAGHYPLLGAPPFTLGWDVAGVVDAVGPGVSDLQVGDRVFGMPNFPGAAATYAEIVVAPVAHLTRTPATLADLEAAALPLVGLTAYQALVEVGQVAAGQRVLIQAAGGGVGHLAVQVAKAHGAYVVATASPGKADFVRGLGADEVRDYTQGSFTDDLEPVDLALDPFGAANTETVLGVVRDGGIVSSLLDFDDGARDLAAARGIRLARIRVAPDRLALLALADLAARGLLVPHVSATYSLEKAGDAHREFDTGVLGKIVLTP
ncbi:NADP-dependent oxidoreductase [Nocardioides sp.]|uniref:NADP-dependent oxidoreductase n=1 Tax=Nocardioides sp. TaxID=35761 RepID=UPI0031FE567F|nr:NADPH:quinone reductase [Nocardioides sp.]